MDKPNPITSANPQPNSPTNQSKISQVFGNPSLERNITNASQNPTSTIVSIQTLASSSTRNLPKERETSHQYGQAGTPSSPLAFAAGISKFVNLTKQEGKQSENEAEIRSEITQKKGNSPLSFVKRLPFQSQEDKNSGSVAKKSGKFNSLSEVNPSSMVSPFGDNSKQKIGQRNQKSNFPEIVIDNKKDQLKNIPLVPNTKIQPSNFSQSSPFSPTPPMPTTGGPTNPFGAYEKKGQNLNKNQSQATQVGNKQTDIVIPCINNEQTNEIKKLQAINILKNPKQNNQSFQSTTPFSAGTIIGPPGTTNTQVPIKNLLINNTQSTSSSFPPQSSNPFNQNTNPVFPKNPQQGTSAPQNNIFPNNSNTSVPLNVINPNKPINTTNATNPTNPLNTMNPVSPFITGNPNTANPSNILAPQANPGGQFFNNSSNILTNQQAQQNVQWSQNNQVMPPNDLQNIPQNVIYMANTLPNQTEEELLSKLSIQFDLNTLNFDQLINQSHQILAQIFEQMESLSKQQETMLRYFEQNRKVQGIYKELFGAINRYPDQILNNIYVVQNQQKEVEENLQKMESKIIPTEPHQLSSQLLQVMHFEQEIMDQQLNYSNHNATDLMEIYSSLISVEKELDQLDSQVAQYLQHCQLNY